jgi:hypothetical protein
MELNGILAADILLTLPAMESPFSKEPFQKSSANPT